MSDQPVETDEVDDEDTSLIDDDLVAEDEPLADDNAALDLNPTEVQDPEGGDIA